MEVTDVDVWVVVCTVACEDVLVVETTAFVVAFVVEEFTVVDFAVDGVVTADVGLAEMPVVVVVFEVDFAVVLAVVAAVVFLTVLAAVVAGV